MGVNNFHFNIYYMYYYYYYFFFFLGGGGGMGEVSLLILTMLFMGYFYNQQLLFVSCDEIYPKNLHQNYD